MRCNLLIDILLVCRLLWLSGIVRQKDVIHADSIRLDSLSTYHG